MENRSKRSSAWGERPLCRPPPCPVCVRACIHTKLPVSSWIFLQSAHPCTKILQLSTVSSQHPTKSKAPTEHMLAPVILLLLAALILRVEASTCPNSVPPDPSALASLPSGKCQTYASELPGGSLSFCNGIVDYSFFMPSTFASQTEMDILAETQLLGTNPNTALLLSILPPSCTLQLKRSVCLAVFQPCEV